MSTPTKTIRLKATEAIQAVAGMFALARTEHNDGKRRQSSNRGAASNSKVDQAGMLAEWLVYCLFTRAMDEPPDDFVPYSETIPTAGDMTVNGQVVDVKCSLPSKYFITINAEQVEKHTGKVQTILPCAWVDDTTLDVYAPVSLESVKGWKLMENSFSPYRSCHHSKLKPLLSLLDLRQYFTGGTLAPAT